MIAMPIAQEEFTMDLVEKAKRLAPQFAEAATGDDQLRRLSDSTWNHLLDGGFLRSSAARAMGRR